MTTAPTTAILLITGAGRSGSHAEVPSLAFSSVIWFMVTYQFASPSTGQMSTSVSPETQ